MGLVDCGKERREKKLVERSDDLLGLEGSQDGRVHRWGPLPGSYKRGAWALETSWVTGISFRVEGAGSVLEISNAGR